MELSKEYQQQLKKGLDLVNFDVFRILPEAPAAEGRIRAAE